MQQANFHELWSQYSTPLRKTAYSIIRHHHDVDDILQNAFLKAWLNAGSLRFGEPNYSWLYRVVYNECLDYLRKSKRRAELLYDKYEQVIPDEQRHTDNLLQRVEIEVLINDLPERQRVICTLHYLEGYTIAKISETLHIPSGTIKSRLSRSRHLLKQSLKDCH